MLLLTRLIKAGFLGNMGIGMIVLPNRRMGEKLKIVETIITIVMLILIVGFLIWRLSIPGGT